MELSVVTTMYHSSPYIHDFYNRIKKVAEKITQDYEIIFVNDGSPDDSLQIVLSFHNKDNKVCVVDLSRNFGHHKAIMTGLSFARGEKVFLIDCDLEEQPELLEPFYKKFSDDDCDVVYGVQSKRKGGCIERVSGDLFYNIFNLISHTHIPHNIVTARLMSKRYVDSLLMFKESEIFLAGLWYITGYKQVPFCMTKDSKGATSYSLTKKMAILINAITSFSNKPLIFIFYTGAIISFVSLVYLTNILIRRLFFGIALSGWSSLIISIWFLGGLTIFTIGVIGMYLSKIFIETKNRPYTIIRAVYRIAITKDA